MSRAVSYEVVDEVQAPWLRRRFGDHYAQISSQTTMKLRSSAKDVARALRGHVPPEIEELTKKFAEPPQGITDHDFVFGYESPEGHVAGSLETDEALREYVRRFPEDWKITQKCLGQVRQSTRHPCAFAICDRPVYDFIPMTEIGGVKCTQYTAASVEAAGALKMDFLVVNSIHDIQDALKLIQQRSGLSIPHSTTINGKSVPWQRIVPWRGQLLDIWDLPEDQDVAREIAEGKTETVFQFSTPGAKQHLRNFNYWKDRASGRKAIDGINAMAAFTALDRPGPLDAYVQSPDGKQHNMLVEYARRSRGEVPCGNIAIFDALFPETLGVLCIAKDQEVKTRRGMIPIQDVVVGDEVQTETGDWRVVVQFWDKGVDEVVRVRMSSGTELRLTRGHEVMTQRGWVKAGELTRRDIVKQFWADDTPIAEGDDKDWIVGLLLADGDLCASTPVVACSDEAFAIKVKEIAAASWGLDPVVFKAGRSWYCRLRHKPAAGTTPNPLTSFLREEGLLNRDFSTKRFPRNITVAMLAGFYEGDGSVLNNRLRIKNRLLARDFWLGLQRARIQSGLFSESGDVWTVSVQGALPLRIKKKLRLQDGVDYVPVPVLKTKPRRRIQDADYQAHRKSFAGRAIAERLARIYGGVVDAGIWGRVLSVTPDGADRVFDLGVDQIHSFVTGGSVTHNCYQEQLQLLYQNLTGCSGSEAEEFRSLVAKKKMEKVQAKYPDWMKKAGEKLGEQEAQTVWNTIITWGQYGFNLSHSVCYVHIAYACAWLKHHYPLEWWCAVLGNAAKKEVGENFWAYCGHLVDMPDVNNPSATFAIVGDRIRAPVALIAGIGAAAQKQLAELGPFQDIVDLVAKVEAWRHAHRKPKIDKATGVQARTKKGELQWTLATTALHRGVIGTLIATGCMDSLFPADMILEERLEAYERALAEARGGKQQPIPPKYLNLTAVDRYRMTKEVLPVYDEPLMPLLRTADPDTWPLSALQGTAKAPIFETPKGGIPVVSWDMLQRLENMSPWPEDHEIVVALPVYVTAQRLFDYQAKSKTACELVLEIEGAARKYVRWPDRKTGTVPAIYRKPLVGALALAFFKRYTEKRPFGLEDVVVFHWPREEKEQDDDAAQKEG